MKAISNKKLTAYSSQHQRHSICCMGAI